MKLNKISYRSIDPDWKIKGVNLTNHNNFKKSAIPLQINILKSLYYIDIQFIKKLNL